MDHQTDDYVVFFLSADVAGIIQKHYDDVSFKNLALTHTNLFPRSDSICTVHHHNFPPMGLESLIIVYPIGPWAAAMGGG